MKLDLDFRIIEILYTRYGCTKFFLYLLAMKSIICEKLE